MSDIFKKLNLKDKKEILIINPPKSFEPELAALTDVTIQRNIESLKSITFSLVFVMQQAEVDSLASAISQRLEGDAILWFAYPKMSSKKYTSDINRDTGWNVLGELGFEPVRQVAIDLDWSALRFRRVEFIKSLTRAKENRLTKQDRE